MPSSLTEAILGTGDEGVTGDEFQLTSYDALLQEYDEESFGTDAQVLAERGMHRQLYGAICRDAKQMGVPVVETYHGGVEVDGDTFVITFLIEGETTSELLNQLPTTGKIVLGDDVDRLLVKGKVSFDKARWYLGIQPD